MPPSLALSQMVNTSPVSIRKGDPHPKSRPSAPTLRLRSYYDTLFAAFGPQHWWPGHSRFEVIVGAILTQNTSWKNVERAIGNLRAAKLISPGAIHAVPAAQLSFHLRPSGYFRQKTKTLKAFTSFLFAHYGGSLNRFFATPLHSLRPQLLALRGIGPETADCILLYAGKHPVFVVDAYTRRILERHDLLPDELAPGARRKQSGTGYERIRTLFESQLPRDPLLFNEFHALIVHTGKNYCFKSEPACELCPLARFLPPDNRSQSTGRRARPALS